MKIDPNLLIEHEWTGTFFPSGRQELSFAGRLRYSPTAGLSLEYARPSDVDQKRTWDYLLGYTSTGVALTLIGKFNSEAAGVHVTNGIRYWTSSGHPFQYAIFGYHFDSETNFEEFNFDISGAKEFFAPGGHSPYIKYRHEPVFVAETHVGEISAFMTGTFVSLGSDVTTVLYDTNDTALVGLQKAYAELKAKHANFDPMLRTTSDYRLKLKVSTEIGVIDAYRTCSSVADLFAVLFFGPARLSELTAIAKDQEGRPRFFGVFPASLSEKGALDQALREKSYFHLPLNSGEVDIARLLPVWLKDCERFETIIAALQGSTGLVSEHEILASIVLSVAQLEGMAKEAGKDQNKEKFQYGINHHASDKICTRLEKLFGLVRDELGVAVAGLRNDIAHVGRPKKYLNALTFDQLYEVSLALELVVVGYVLDRIGLDRASRDKYQDSLLANV